MVGDGKSRTASRLAGVLAVLLLGGMLGATLLAGVHLWWVSLRGAENAPAGASKSGPPAPAAANDERNPALPQPASGADNSAPPPAASASETQTATQAQPASAAGAAPLPAGSIRLAWDRSPDSGVTGYRILWGTRPGYYSDSLPVGNQTTATLTGLQSGTRYYIVAVAVDASGNQSLPSNELEVTTRSP